MSTVKEKWEDASVVFHSLLTPAICREARMPESWHCVDCDFNTAPGFLSRAEVEQAIEVEKAAGRWTEEDGGLPQYVDNLSEVYTVRDAVWKRASMEKRSGCLCVGCLEKRLGRRLKPKDFQRGDVFNVLPGTKRLLNRQKRTWVYANAPASTSARQLEAAE